MERSMVGYLADLTAGYWGSMSAAKRDPYLAVKSDCLRVGLKGQHLVALKDCWMVVSMVEY